MDLGAGPGVSFFEQPDGGTDLTGRAVTALIGVVPDKGLLHGMKPVAISQAFDGNDLCLPLCIMRPAEDRNSRVVRSPGRYRRRTVTRSQPFLVPVRERCSRKASNKVTRLDRAPRVYLCLLMISSTDCVWLFASSQNQGSCVPADGPCPARARQPIPPRLCRD